MTSSRSKPLHNVAIQAKGRAVISLIIALLTFATYTAIATASPHSVKPHHPAPSIPPLAQGGPDAFGYTYKDSNEPGGPVYNWDDISASGTLVTNWTSSDDGYAGPLPIGFSFNYYGADFTELYAGTNGYITFGQGTGAIPSGALPSPSDPDNDVALFGGDMYLTDYGAEARVYYQTLANPTRFVLQYVNLHYCCGNNTPHTFEVVLYPNGDIQAQYKALNGTSTSYVGIENATGADGLAYSLSLVDFLALRYYYPRGVFLTPSEQFGTGYPGEVITYTVQIANDTGVADTFDLTVQSGNTWPTSLSIAQTGVLTDGASLTFEAWVSVPDGVTPGQTDLATIGASSVTSPTLPADTAELHTLAIGGEIAYVPLSQSNLVALVDTATYTVIHTVDVGAAGCLFPWRAAITPGGDEVYVSCYNSDNVVVISTTGNVVAATVSGINRPDGVAFTRSGAFALVGSRSYAQISVVDTETHAVTHVPTPGVTRSIAAHPYRNLAYVTCSNGTILVLDTAALAVTTTIPAVADPWDIAISPDGLWVFAGSRQGGGLAIINTADNSLQTVIGGLGSLTGLEVAPNGSVVYASSLSNGIHVIDTASFQAVATITGVGQPWELASTCQGDALWVGNSSSTVPVVDTTGLIVAQSVTMPGNGVKGLTICPQRTVQNVLLLPTQQTHTGAPGNPVTHTLTVVNATGRTDTFHLSLTPNLWPATLSTTTVGPLADGQIATVDVVVTIPGNTAWYQTTMLEVRVTSAGLPSYNATATVTTEANAPPILGVTPLALSNTQSVNQVVDQTLTIGNGNGLTLTVAIEDVALTPTTVLVRPLDLPRAADVFPGDPAAVPDLQVTAPPPPPQSPVARVLAEGHQPTIEIQAGQLYTTTLDNEDNSHTGSPDYDMDTNICGGYYTEPVEFNIFVDRAAGPENNVLTIRAYDVDLPDEVDEVRLNGTYLGRLAGAEGSWSETTFVVPQAALVVGANLVEIDLIGDGWCTTVDWGELLVASQPALWLRETPSSATIATNSSADITITFDATDLQPQTYLGAVVLTSNDPVQPYLQVPVTMTVLPTPDMGRVVGAVSDLWTGLPLAATANLIGVFATPARPNFEIWATAGAYTLEVSAPGYVTATLPIAITAGGTTVQDVALEPYLTRLEWSPSVVHASVSPGGATAQLLTIANTGPAPLDVALFEIDFSFVERPPTPADLTGKRILYDRAHGQPQSSEYSTLVTDAIAAGAVVDENWYFPVDPLVLDGYDILWTTCCGNITWGLSELLAVHNWLREGGALFVQGENSPSTAGPASVFEIYYFSASCTNGWTSNIAPHPITDGVTTVDVEGTCWRLSPSSGSTVAVYDPAGQPHVVVKEQDGGKIVAVASEDFINWHIGNADNRLLANNILGWLARPAYSNVPWLAIQPTGGTVPGHSNLPVTVSFDASALASGVYEAALAIEHNDASQPFPIEVPVTLTVRSPTAVALGELATGPAPAPASAPALPLAALPVAAVVALAWAGWTARTPQRTTPRRR